MEFDVAVLGSGPGGYIAAIRAAQLGHSVVIIEKDKLGGVCLNRGCIPTKALLKAGEHAEQLKHLGEFGINIEILGLDGQKAVQRANQIAGQMNQGVEFLMKKNKIQIVRGHGEIISRNEIKVNSDTIKAANIIVATGAQYRSFPGLEHDGDRLIGAWEALKLENLPKTIGIVGAGAIGVEFAYFWNAFGVDVHIFEVQKHLLPIEDIDSSKALERAYKKRGIKFSLGVKDIQAKNNGDNVTFSTSEGEYSFDYGLIAVGMTGNIEKIGLENIGVESERGFIKVNQYNQTNIENIYAIGDVSGAPLLAHAASHEGVLAAEHLSGKEVHPIEKLNIPGCTYCQPQVASVGYTEQALKEKGIEYKLGKVPFLANGKARAAGETEGHIKVLLGTYGEILGAHIVGHQATELIHEYSVARSMEGIDEEIIHAVHPHPTLGEFLAEAVLQANGKALNL